MTGGADASRESSKSDGGKGSSSSGGGEPIHTGATEGSPERIDGDKSSQSSGGAKGPPGRSGSRGY